MRKWLIFALLLGLIIFPSAADAQGGTNLKSINVELWSEYDQPSMLVIHEFAVAEGTPLPAKISLRFPKDGNLIGVAFNSAGQLLNAEFEGPKVNGNWQVITLNVQSYDPHRIEYYQPLARGGNKRQFSFQWLGDYPTQQFNLGVFLPSDSKNIITLPELSVTNTSQDKLHLIGAVNRSNLKMGQSYKFQIEYTRESESVTNPSQAADVQPSEPVGANTPGRVSIDNLPWIIGGVGLAFIIVALFAYWRSTKSSPHSSTPLAGLGRRRHGGEEESAAPAYCHECGARAHAGDRFCRTCGSKLRIE